MTDIRKWLDSLGLGQFGDAFAENAIDWELLPKLNHELLEAIGISAVGHRMRILDAAQQLLAVKDLAVDDQFDLQLAVVDLQLNNAFKKNCAVWKPRSMSGVGP